MRRLEPILNHYTNRYIPVLTTSLAMWAIGWALFEIFGFRFFDLVTLAVTGSLALYFCRYDSEFSKKGVPVSLQSILSFWGIIAVGAAGGITIAFLGALAANRGDGSLRRIDLAEVSVNVTATAAAAFTFSASIGYLNGLFDPLGYSGFTFPTAIIASIVLMAAVRLLASAVLRGANYLSETGTLGRSFRGSIVNETVRHLTTLAATVLLLLAFNHFGIELGFVIIPAVILADLAYKIHVRLLGQKTKEIIEASRIYLSTVEVLASATDAREDVGMGHVRRTQIYAVETGRLLGITNDEENALKIGSLLHDIGKLAVPDHILNKPGRLTPAELEKTKIHASVGASILEKVGFPFPVVPTVRYHHESWNGSGYPDGLSGHEIPFTARILSVADTYDTLRGARPYRPPVAREHAAEFLRNGAGTRFDPRIVGVFLENLDRFEERILAEGLGYDVSWVDPNGRDVRIGETAGSNFFEQIKSANREVLSLYTLAREFSGSLDLEQTMSLFAKKVADFVPFDTCIVYLLDGTAELATAAHVVGRNAEYLRKNTVKVGEGATGFVLEKWTSVENVDPTPDFVFTDSGAGSDFVTMVSLPLISDRRLIGAVSLYSETLAMYQDEHIRLLETVLRIAADAIANALRHAEAESHAMTDPMTELPNSRHLQVQFDKEMIRAERKRSTFQLLVLDLDGFKAVNDNFGHRNGDLMLKGIASVIREQLREYDFLARYGGDEFVAIIPETDDEHFRSLCERIENAVEGFKLKVGSELSASVGVSLGSATFPHHGETFDQLIVEADRAMYSRKAVNKRRRESDFQGVGNTETDTMAVPNLSDTKEREINSSMAIN